MRSTWIKPSRTLHRLGAILTLLPFGLVIVTGILLQVKKQVPWVQPPTAKGTDQVPSLSFEHILEAAKKVPEAEINSWDDVDRLDVRPSKGITKVRSKNNWEVQVDTTTGEVLQVAYRRSDTIEALHDGSWFHDKAKTWLFLPAAVIVFAMWLTGLYLWVVPYIIRSRRRKAPS